ncbi:hypothetical protein HW115_14165 [Verrucomicrobiaceae bacterium N1E253]|uniref:AB hydrolase-1 domain-containing protein n=1 Tax=Oceaniferula marina TaxID=2748318 RepID=A0A851GGV8_9BACT|nr:hypothetical protein [Oceaniferula marina]NWK56763.1 hypothetical protein [Oceaniferula marina]
MSSILRYSHFLTGLIAALLLGACTQDPYFRSSPTYIAYNDAPASTLNRAWMSGSSLYYIQCMQMQGRKTPSSNDERIAIAEREVFRAQKSLGKSREQAAAHYLKAAETLWPVVRDNANPSERAYWGEKKRLIIAHQLYIHAVGQTTELLVHSRQLKKGMQGVQLGGRTLNFNTESPHTLHPSFFDEVHPIDTHVYGNVGANHYTSTGLGAAIIGSQSPSPERKQHNPLLSPDGMHIPVNAIIDYPRPGHARLTLTNLLETDQTRITGSPRPLSADYSAAVAATMDSESSLLGLSIALAPQKFNRGSGLFSLGPYDPGKIPVIFIHGLISQPSTWTTPTNFLLADKTIRENYQFFYYFYPTSISPLVTGTELRSKLLTFYRQHNVDANRELNRTVLIGHSMGGILSSVQSRQFDEDLWNRLFKHSSETINDPQSVMARARPLFSPPVLEPIDRVVFVATPHRGSELANNWIGRIGASLITLPKNIISLQVSATAENMTELGRSLINSDGPADSISRLKPNNPSLKFLIDQPFSQKVTYHSIIGDRGKNNPAKSSDGVVPYWSSHMEGAASEKIVPANHEAHLHPEAHHELSRILHLHLKQQKR